MTTPDYNEQFFRLMQLRVERFSDKRLPSDAMTEALALIEDNKLDYAWANSKGQSVLGVMLDKVTSRDERELLIRKMLGVGCNPLKGPDKELNAVFNDLCLRTTLVQFAAAQERDGRGLRDSMGGNIYHRMAQINCLVFGDAVERITTNAPVVVLTSHRENPAFTDEDLNPGMVERLTWLHLVRTDGSTPLHLLWSPETLAYEVEIDQGVVGAERTAASINSMSIYTTAMLVGDIGLDLLTPNLAGIRALDLMEARNLAALYTLADDTLESGKLLDGLRADVQTRILERDTPVASGRKTGVRL